MAAKVISIQNGGGSNDVITRACGVRTDFYRVRVRKVG